MFYTLPTVRTVATWIQDTALPVEPEWGGEKSKGLIEPGFELKKKKNVLTPEWVRSWKWEWEFGSERGAGVGVSYNYSWDCECERDWDGLRAILLFLKCGRGIGGWAERESARK
jgi:hypothetical protein